MTEETARAITEEIVTAIAELESWATALGVPMDDVVKRHGRLIQNEDFAEVVRLRAGDALGLTIPNDFGLVSFDRVRSAVESGALFSLMLTFPEPSFNGLHVVFQLIGNALDHVRAHFVAAGRATTDPKRSGRRGLLKQPRLREKIREEIRLRRKHDKMDSIFTDIGKELGVSNTTIKRIWLENPEEPR